MLKSSGPVYTPIVTRYPPSTCSSFKLRSLSLILATLSFSNFRASLSCFVSRRSGTSLVCELEPIPKKERSGLLPLPVLELYNVGLSVEGDAGPLPPPVESTSRADGCDSEPRDSLVGLFPIVQRGDPQEPDQQDIEEQSLLNVPQIWKMGSSSGCWLRD